MATTLRQLPIRRSLIRPLLLAGGERPLVMTNCTIIAALLLGLGLNTFTVITAILLATLGQWCLVQSAKNDPDMTQIYLRHIRYQEFYAAQSPVHKKVPPILTSLR